VSPGRNGAQIEHRFRAVARQPLDRDRPERKDRPVVEIDVEVRAGAVRIDRRPAPRDARGRVAILSQHFQRVLLRRFPCALTKNLARGQGPPAAHPVRDARLGLLAEADRNLAHAHGRARLDAHPHHALRAAPFDPRLDPGGEETLRRGDVARLVTGGRDEGVEQIRCQVVVGLPALDFEVRGQDLPQRAGSLDFQPEPDGARGLLGVRVKAESTHNET
jgi:hypothetical protein